MIRWTGLAPWEFEFPLPGSLTYTFLVNHSGHVGFDREQTQLSRSERGNPAGKILASRFFGHV